MWLPCSRCPRCRARIAAKWRTRIEAELSLPRRSWFGTLTFRPSQRYVLLTKASTKYGPGFDGLPETHRFRLIEREAYVEAQKYWKRLRKETGLKIKYIMVAEAHADGSLHYHAILHEPVGSELRHATLTKQWWHGFTKWKLINRTEGAARYVTKYLTKSNATRTRASEHYGGYTLKVDCNEVKQRGITVVRGNPTPTNKPTRDAVAAGTTVPKSRGGEGAQPPFVGLS